MTFTSAASQLVGGLTNATGTYTDTAGTTAGSLEALEHRFDVDDELRATMEVVLARASIASPEIGGTWSSDGDVSDGKTWDIHAIRRPPGALVLEVEHQFNTGANT